MASQPAEHYILMRSSFQSQTCYEPIVCYLREGYFASQIFIAELRLLSRIFTAQGDPHADVRTDFGTSQFSTPPVCNTKDSSCIFNCF